jgi:hypothetical protein
MAPPPEHGDGQHATKPPQRPTMMTITAPGASRWSLSAPKGAVALAQRRPVILLTGNPDDLAWLTEEPDRRKRERIAVIGL